jgi:hypothetical protein
VDTSPGGCATRECAPEPGPAEAPLPASAGWTKVEAPAAATIREVAEPAPPAPAPQTHAGPLDRAQWRAVVEAVRAESARHGKSLAFGRLLRSDPGELVVAFTAECDFHRSTVSGTGRGLIEEALSRILGRPTRLVVDQHGAASAPPSLAEEEAKERLAHEKSVESRIRRHPALLATLRMFGGEVEHIQMLERERPAAAEPEPVDDGS